MVPINDQNGTFEILSLVNSNHQIECNLNVLQYLPIHQLKDVLIECLDAVHDLVDQRNENITHLHENINNVFVTNKGQNISAEVIIYPSVYITETLLVHNLIITTNATDISNNTNSAVLEEVLDTQKYLEQAQNDSNTVVFKSREQTINASIKFCRGFEVEYGKISRISNDVVLNGQMFSRYQKSALKLSGNQTIIADLCLNNLTVEDNLKVEEHLNGKNVEDIILSNVSQFVTGQFGFESAVMFDNLTVHTINGVAPGYLVLTIGLQLVDGLKAFDVLHTSSIDILGNTNKVSENLFMG